MNVQPRVPYWRRLLTGLAHATSCMAANLPSQHLRQQALTLLGMRIGKESAIYGGAEVRSPWRIRIGDFSAIGTGAVLDGRGGLHIGNCVNMSSEVMLWTNQHDYRAGDFRVMAAPVVIGDYVWLGPRVIVLPGVTIAPGCVVAAGAVVTRNTEAFGVYAGVPAKRIAERPRELDYKPGRDYVPLI